MLLNRDVVELDVAAKSADTSRFTGTHHTHLVEGHIAWPTYLGILREGQAALSRIRARRVIDEQVEAAKLLADALRRLSNRNSIRHFELR